MKKPKHTPGPWKIGMYGDESEPEMFAIVIKNKTICNLDQTIYEREIDDKTCEANARLIAAAPESLVRNHQALEVLKGILYDKNAYDERDLEIIIEKLEQTIAKAEGSNDE